MKLCIAPCVSAVSTPSWLQINQTKSDKWYNLWLITQNQVYHFKWECVCVSARVQINRMLTRHEPSNEYALVLKLNMWIRAKHFPLKILSMSKLKRLEIFQNDCNAIKRNSMIRSENENTIVTETQRKTKSTFSHQKFHFRSMNFHDVHVSAEVCAVRRSASYHMWCVVVFFIGFCYYLLRLLTDIVCVPMLIEWPNELQTQRYVRKLPNKIATTYDDRKWPLILVYDGPDDVTPDFLPINSSPAAFNVNWTVTVTVHTCLNNVRLG